MQYDVPGRGTEYRLSDPGTFISDLLYTQTLCVWHLTFDESDRESEVAMEKAEIEETLAAFSRKEPEAAKKLRRKIILAWIDRLHKYFTRF